jgi:hypothetical protein
MMDLMLLLTNQRQHEVTWMIMKIEEEGIAKTKRSDHSSPTDWNIHVEAVMTTYLELTHSSVSNILKVAVNPTVL